MPGLADIIIDSNFIDGLRGLVDLAIVEADKLHTYSAGGTPSSTVGALNQGSNGIYRSAPTGQFSAITNPDGSVEITGYANPGRLISDPRNRNQKAFISSDKLGRQINETLIPTKTNSEDRKSGVTGKS